MGMHLHLLGPIEATFDGRPIPLGATKQRALLAMLALEANAAVPVDRLVDGLWGDDPPPTAPKMVQLYVSHLRRILDGDEARIVTHGRGYELRLDGDAIDVARFERLVEQAGRAEAQADGAAGALAREALGLWRGPALSDVATEPFAAAEIHRLDELRAIATERAIDDDLAEGRDHEALAGLERLLAHHPLREHLHAKRMLALYRAGRQVEALDAYRAAHRRLVEEAGVEPGAELRELHDRILRQDPALRRPPATALPPAGRSPSPAGRPPAAPPMPPAGRPPSSRRLVLVAVALVVCAAGVFALSRLGGSDGLAAVEEGGVGVIDPETGVITRQYRHVGVDPQLVVGGAGSVWVANPNAATVSRLRDSSDPLVEPIDVGGRPSALAFGGGSLWVGDEDHGDVAQVDPAIGRVLHRIPIGNGLRALAVGHGALWIATALDGEVVRFDLGSGRVTRRSPVGGRPSALAVSRDAVWVAAEETGQVLRLDPRSGRVLDAIDVGGGPGAIAVGEGAVWVANRQDGTVWRIDPESDRVVLAVPAGRAPAALAVAGGAVWVGDADGAVLRLDPETNAINKVIATGSVPAGLATFHGAVWVTGVAPPAAHRGGTLRVGRSPLTLDPAQDGYDPSAMGLLELAYDGLVRYQRAGGAAAARLVPGLAIAVPGPVDGGHRYVFRLRKGGRYADGTPVRARDVRASLERMLMIRGDELPEVYDAIVGARRCRTAPAACDLSRGVVTDERDATVTFRLGRPDPELVQKLAIPLAMVVPSGTPRHAMEQPIPGTGPYRVTRLVAGHRALLTRNVHFRPAQAGGRAAGFVDRVEVLMAGDERVNLAALERGRLDMAGVFLGTSREVAGLRTRHGSGLRSGIYSKTIYAWMNVRASPFDDVRVRRAVNLAVDRNRAVDALGGPDAGTPTCQLLPPGLPGYRPICPFTAGPSPAGAWIGPDRDKAKSLVAAAGRRGTRVVVWAPKDWSAIGRQLVTVLHDLGFRSRLRRFVHLSAIGSAAHAPREHPQIGLNGWIADYPEPAGFLRALIGCSADTGVDPGGVGFSRFCDPGIDAAMERARAAGPAAGTAWRRIEERIARRAPVAPLFNGRFTVVTSARTGNVRFNALSGPLLDEVWVR